MVGRIKALIGWVRHQLAMLRARRPMVDHLFQAAGRYSRENGSRLTSVITLPGFLSFFPLLGLALSVAGYVSHYDSHAQAQIVRAVQGYFPGLNVGNLVTSIVKNRASTGIISLLGLLVSGLGLITTLRGALRTMFHLPQKAGNFFLAKGRDLVALLSLGLALIGSFVLSAGATSATTVIVRHTPLPDGGIGKVALQIAALAIGVGANVLLFGVAFVVLPQVKSRLRDTLDGALLAAIGFEVLQSVGAVYLHRTTSNPLYGSFAVAIGLLVWTNLVAKLFVFCAAWAVTAPYTPDTPPSGTAVGSIGVPAVPAPADTRPELSRRQRATAQGAGTAAFGAVAGVAVVLGVRALRAVVPRR